MVLKRLCVIWIHVAPHLYLYLHVLQQPFLSLCSVPCSTDQTVVKHKCASIMCISQHICTIDVQYTYLHMCVWLYVHVCAQAPPFKSHCRFPCYMQELPLQLLVAVLTVSLTSAMLTWCSLSAQITAQLTAQLSSFMCNFAVSLPSKKAGPIQGNNVPAKTLFCWSTACRGTKHGVNSKCI